MNNRYHIVKLNAITNSWLILAESNSYDDLVEQLDFYWRVYPNTEIAILERRSSGESQ